MATTDNEKWADRMRIMSLHGISKDAWKRFTKSGSWFYEIVEPGFKYNLTDIASSIGIHQLRKADKFMNERKKIAYYYGTKLKDIPGLALPYEKENTLHSWHLYAVRIDSKVTGIHRDEVIEKLKENNIGSSVHYIPLHLHPYYRDKYGLKKGDFPNAERIFDQCLSLPIFPGLTKSELDRICGALKNILEGSLSEQKLNRADQTVSVPGFPGTAKRRLGTRADQTVSVPGLLGLKNARKDLIPRSLGGK
jgi:perosamine synthetase